MIRPAVSVIIPAYNAASYVAETLQSIYTGFSHAQVILVDDGSTDNTRQIVQDQFPQVEIRPNPGRRGPSSARNVGVRHAQSDIVFFLDADDVLHKEAISLLLRPFDDPSIAASFSDFCYFDSTANFLNTPILSKEPHFASIPKIFIGEHFKIDRQDLFRGLLSSGYPIVGASGVAYRRATLLENGGFDETISYSEDFCLALKISQSWDVAFTSRVLLARRRHVASLTRQVTNAMLEDSVAYVKAKFLPSRDNPNLYSYVRRAIANQYCEVAYCYRTEGRWTTAIHRYYIAWKYGASAIKILKGLLGIATLFVRRPRNK